VRIPFALYDTQGVTILKSVDERVPGFDDLGIEYGDMDSLGIWLALRRHLSRVVVGMRIDHVFESAGLGRDNRYILLLEVELDELPTFVQKFEDVINRILEELKNTQNAIYKGKTGPTPQIDREVVNRIIELIDEVSKYPEEVLNEFGMSRERLRVRVDGLDYDDPGIGDRKVALQLMASVLESRPMSPLTELIVFSKSSSSKYGGLWIEKNAKTPEELLLVLSNIFTEMSRKLSECVKDRERYRSEAEELRERASEYRSRLRKLENRPRGISLPIAALAMVALLIAGFFGGAYLHSAGVLPLFGKPAKIVKVSDNTITGLALNASTLQDNSSRSVVLGYISFINESQRTYIVKFNELSTIVGRDIELHRAHLKEINGLKARIKELNETLTEGEKKIQNLSVQVESLEKERNEFKNESGYFALVCGRSNVTLTPEDFKNLSQKPGIDGWTVVMGRHCKAKLNESKNEIINMANAELELLGGPNGTVSILNGTVVTLVAIRDSKNFSETNIDIPRNLTLFIDAINESLATAQTLLDSWRSFMDNVEKDYQKAETCRDSYEYMKRWNDEFPELEEETLENLSNTQAYQVVEVLYNLSRNNTDYRYEDLKSMDNIPESVLGLVYFVQNTYHLEDFWRLVRKWITEPSPDSLESINRTFEELSKVFEELIEVYRGE